MHPGGARTRGDGSQPEATGHSSFGQRLRRRHRHEASADGYRQDMTESQEEPAPEQITDDHEIAILELREDVLVAKVRPVNQT